MFLTLQENTIGLLQRQSHGNPRTCPKRITTQIAPFHTKERKNMLSRQEVLEFYLWRPSAAASDSNFRQLFIKKTGR